MFGAEYLESAQSVSYGSAKAVETCQTTKTTTCRGAQTCETETTTCKTADGYTSHVKETCAYLPYLP